MFKVKLIVVLLISATIFISCEDQYPDDSYRNHVAFNLPEGDGIGEVEIGNTYKYKGEIHNGPAETIEVEHSKYREDEHYTGWLNARLVDEGHTFILEGKPDTVDTFHFSIEIKRADSTEEIGSYGLGFKIEVLEKK